MSCSMLRLIVCMSEDYCYVKWIYCLLVWLLRYELTMKFYYCLWMPKTERVWTLTLVFVACDFYFYNILIFICTGFGLSLGVSDPHQIACYEFWNVVNILVMLPNFGRFVWKVISITWGAHNGPLRVVRRLEPRFSLCAWMFYFVWCTRHEGYTCNAVERWKKI